MEQCIGCKGDYLLPNFTVPDINLPERGSHVGGQLSLMEDLAEE